MREENIILMFFIKAGRSFVTLFLSTYINKIDKKSRISIPAQFRAVLSGQEFSGIIAYPSFVYDCIEACGIDRIEKLSDSIDNLDPYSEERDAFATSILGGCVQLSFDGEGRVHIPDALINLADLKDQAVFVGKGQTFEIWEPTKFEEYSTSARALAKQHRAALHMHTKKGVE